MARPSSNRNHAPLEAESLQRLALDYAARYATTRAKLAAYLRRKLGERGWAGAASPDIEALVERMAELGYVDDRAFAAARVASLARRGYGPRRQDAALTAAGIDRADRRMALADGEAPMAAALAFARRRRIGPFAAAMPDRPARAKAFAAMLRAGHAPDVVERLLALPPGHPQDRDG